MSATEPVPASPLGEAGAPGRHGERSGLDRLAYSERAGLTLLLLRGRADAPGFASGVEAALGAALPLAPNTTSRGTQATLLWLGPDEWLVSGAPSAQTVSALAGCAGALVDVSHGRVALRVRGRAARDLLAKGLPLDTHPRAFPTGACAQSAMARCNVLVHRVDDAPTFDLYVMRSFARSLWHFLCEAGEELGYEVARETT